MANEQCLICNSVQNRVAVRVTNHIDCPRCGRYSITYEAGVNWDHSYPTERQQANASGWIREHQDVEIVTANVDSLLAIPTPSFTDRVQKALMAIDAKAPTLGQDISISEYREQLIAETWSVDGKEMDYLVDTYLTNEAKYLSAFSTGDMYDVSITPKGYAYIDEFKTKPTTSSVGFCAMWFDNSVKPIWTQAIEPAIFNAGYEPKRIDAHHHNNRIDDEIIALIRRSKFVVADFTAGAEPRGGVYFEAGYALGLGLPVIWTVRKDYLEQGKIHFDNRQYNFLLWEEGDLEGFKMALQNRIEATLGRGTYR